MTTIELPKKLRLGPVRDDPNQAVALLEIQDRFNQLIDWADAGTLVTHIDWSGVENTPTTIAGYGITDAYTKTEVDALIEAVEDEIAALTFADIGGQLAYAQLPSGGGTWANGGALAITGGALSLSGDLKFVADATYDIGKSGATRPRDAFFSRNLVVGGSITFGSLVGTIAYSNLPTGSGVWDTVGVTTITIQRSLIVVGTLTGTLTGNADTATKLQTARLIWGQSFDGSAAVSGAFSNATSMSWSGNVLNDLLFTDATYDIGKTGATRPRDGFFSRNLVVGGNVTLVTSNSFFLNAGQTSGFKEQIAGTVRTTAGSSIVMDQSVSRTIIYQTLQGSANASFNDVGANVGTTSIDNSATGSGSRLIGYTGSAGFGYWFAASTSDTNFVVGPFEARSTFLVTGNVVSDLKFTDATYDIGKSGATRPRDIFASRDLTVGGTTTLSGNLLFSATDTYNIGVANVAATVAVTSPKNGYFTGTLVVGTRAQIPSPLPAIHVVQPNAAQAARFDLFSSIAPFSFFRANGTPLIPTKSLATDTLGGVASFNHTGAAFGSGPSARILMIAIENGDVGRGAYMQFGTAPAGGSVTARWRISEDGHLWPESTGNLDIGTTSSSQSVRTAYLNTIIMGIGGTPMIVFDGLALVSSQQYIKYSTTNTLQIVLGNAQRALVNTTALSLDVDLKFTDATYDIGKTGATRPRDGFFSRNVEIGGTLLVTGVTTHSAPTRLKNYTVATLPAGVAGYAAYVTDALLPAFLGVVTGGGAVVTPVFYDGTNWIVF